MCIRYQLRGSVRRVREVFGVSRGLFEPTLPAEYFPTQKVPVVRAGERGRELVGMTWGIELGRRRVTNSREDKLSSTWRRFVGRRVVFPVSRAVEWHYELDLLGEATGKPRPWAIERADGELSAVAGIASVEAVSMVTCPGAGLYRDVHNKDPQDPRMVSYLVEPDDVARWLDPTLPFEAVRSLIKPPPAGWLDAAAL